MSYFNAITQSVKEATGNSSSTNLASGATWAGTPVSTLGVVGLQWNLNTDQNCTVYSEESEGSHTGLGTVETAGTTTLLGTSTVFERSFVVGDTISVSGETDRIIATIVSDTELTVTVAFSTTASGLSYTHYHWDISHPFNFLAIDGAKGEGETVQATMAYWRLRVVNEGTDTTTYFRVSGILCPIAVPLPSALTDDRRLKVETTITGRQNETRHAWINPTNEQAVSPVYRMVGTAFDGTSLDGNFWTPTLVNGSVTQSGGAVTLLTSAAINSSAKYSTVHKARFVAGSAQLFTAGLGMTVAPASGNTRRIGAYNTTDGFFFQVAGTTFSIGTRKASSDSLINTGSFNGNLGLSWSPALNVFYKIQIEFTPLAAIWYINGVKLHSIMAPNLSNTLTLPVTIETINDGTISTDMDLICVGAYIARQGELTTNPIYKFAGTNGLSNATHILKYGAGVLHRVTVTDNTGTLLIYDGLSAAGVLMANLDASKTVGTMEFGAPFSDGLTVVVASTPKMTIVYE